MDDPSFANELFKMLLALIFVLGLMGLMVYVLRRFGIAGASNTIRTATTKKRLSVQESLMLDARRRAVLIRRDDQEHLVILSQSGETVIETNIPAQDTEQTNEST